MSYLLRQPRQIPQQGFGLLEVLVSMVIFASVGLTLLSWFQQSVDTVQRLRAFYELQEARRSVLELVGAINPAKKPSGEQTVGAWRISWTSQPQGEELIQMGFPQGQGRHRLRLYATAIQVYRGVDTHPWFSEKLTLVGHVSAGALTGMFGDE